MADSSDRPPSQKSSPRRRHQTVFAGGCVDALVGEPQAFHRAALDEVRLHDLLDVREPHEPVPHGLGVHDDGDAVFTLIETAGLVDPHQALQTVLLGEGFEGLTDGRRAFAATTPLGVPRRSLVEANKDVSLKPGHGYLLRGYAGDCRNDRHGGER